MPFPPFFISIFLISLVLSFITSSSSFLFPSLLFCLLPHESFPPSVPHASPSVFLFISFPSRSSLTDSFASALLFLISKSSDSEKSQHALPKLLIFPPPPPLILHSHHCNQAQRTPYAQTYNPHLPSFRVCFLSFSLSRLRGREWGEFRQTS